MASVDRLPSGKWRATVVLPLRTKDGRKRRITKTHRLRSVVVAWAQELEGAVAAGKWLHPKGADVTLAEYRERWAAQRLTEGRSSAKVGDSHWRNHIEPVWGGHPVGLITRPELRAWVKRMAETQCAKCRGYPGVKGDGMLARHKVTLTGAAAARAAKRKEPLEQVCTGTGQAPGLGAWTIQGAVTHLSALLTAAVDDGLIPANPALRLGLPPTRPKPVFFWTRSEAAAIVAQLDGLNATAVDLAMHVGLRPGELFGLKRRYIDTDIWLIHVHGVATRDGWKPHAKTAKSHRAVPVPPKLRAAIAARCEEIGPDDLVFPAPTGGVWDDRNFAERVFAPAVRSAGVKTGTPYDMRHTAASWLVQAGVDLQRVQELLGHEKYSTTLRYAHLRPGAFDEVLAAWGEPPTIDA